MKALLGILVLIIGVLLLLAQSGIAAGMNVYIGWINAILVVAIGIMMLMKKE